MQNEEQENESEIRAPSEAKAAHSDQMCNVQWNDVCGQQIPLTMKRNIII